MTRSTWLTILLVVIGACVAFAVYTRMHPAALPKLSLVARPLESDAGQRSSSVSALRLECLPQSPGAIVDYDCCAVRRT